MEYKGVRIGIGIGIRDTDDQVLGGVVEMDIDTWSRKATQSPTRKKKREYYEIQKTFFFFFGVPEWLVPVSRKF